MSWPLVLLHVDQHSLVFVSPVMIRRFSPHEVIAFEQVKWIPFHASGVRIVHLRDDTPEDVFFRPIGPTRRVLEAIELVGFVPTGQLPPVDNAASTSADDKPLLRPQFLGAAVLVAGLCALLGLLPLPIREAQESYGEIALVGLVFGASLLIRRPGWFRRFAMTSPDAPPRWRALLNFLTLGSGLVFFGLLAEMLGY
jgi:hypothetical protein